MHRLLRWMLVGLASLWSVHSIAQGPLDVSVSEGSLIHDASYLPRPSFWPPEWTWDGTGLNDDTSYRYGPALIRYDNDNLHFWACSEGDANVADYIRYRNSSNGGRTWSDDVIALAPTIGSPDGWAICDPNVIKYGGYYYLAYTATDSSFGAGLNNQIFVARSLQANGGFEKWNGSGWGGAPQPIIQYSGPTNQWGLGEPNMVVKGNTLFFYFTEDEGVARTKVATASISDPNWPLRLNDRGYAIADRDWAEDQTDVKYLPEIDRFMATAVASRFTSSSYIHVWQSADGLRFEPVVNDNITENVQPFAHNMGVSGSELGHAAMGENEYIAYSYTGPDGGWGRWNTWLSKLDIGAAGWIASNSATPPDMPMMPIILILLDE